MSQETGAGINTVSYAFTNPELEDPNGRIPLVAPGGKHYTPDSPNSEFSGAQPETTTSAALHDGSATAYEPTHLHEPIAVNPQLADVFEYRVRYRHTPVAPYGWKVQSEDAFGQKETRTIFPEIPTPPGGRIITETLEIGTAPVAAAPVGNKSDTAIREAEPSVFEPASDETIVLPSLDEQPSERGRTRWYNPADVARRLHIKLRPELWTRRASVAVTLGGIATSAIGAYMAYSGAKHGGGHQLVDRLWGTNFSDNTGHPIHNTPAPTVTPAFTPDIHHAPEPATPQPEPEHFRTAIPYDHDTHRASTATDWSRDALEAAGKKAGLTHAELREVTHNTRFIHTVNHALYEDNPDLTAANNPHHFLKAQQTYITNGQQEAADQLIAKLEHNNPVVAANTAPETTSQADTALPSDEALAKQLREIIDEQRKIGLDEQAATPTPQPETAWWDVTEYQPRHALIAVGGIAVVAAAAREYRARHAAKIERNASPENNGGITVHRERSSRNPTIPYGQSPRAYYAQIDAAYLRARAQDTETLEPVTV